MKRAALIVTIAALTTLPALAQQIDWGVWAVSATLQGDNLVDPEQRIEINFDENVGAAVTGDIRWGGFLSTEIGIYAFDADGTIDLGVLDEQIDLGTFNVTPITATLRAHFGSGAVDFYVGAGAAYVLLDDLISDDLSSLGTEIVEVDDEVTWLANAGLGWWFSDAFGVGIDAKWIGLEADTLSDTGEELQLELDPLMISGGLLLRF